jgi:hypothetical protein
MYSKRTFLTLEKTKKKKTLHLGVFWYFHMGIFFNKEGHGGVFGIFTFCFKFFNKKSVGVCFTHASQWVARMTPPGGQI